MKLKSESSATNKPLGVCMTTFNSVPCSKTKGGQFDFSSVTDLSNSITEFSIVLSPQDMI